LILRGRVTSGSAGLAAIAAVLVVLASGCGYGGVASAASHPDPQSGGTLFLQNCGSCHTLQAAGTSGTLGPNLDNAFAGSRKQGYGPSTIENVVLDQIRIGTVSPILAPYKTEKDFTSKKCLAPATKKTCYGPEMQANIVTGQNAIDVAAYVASAAAPPPNYYVTGNLGLNGATIFTGIGCSGCHALKAAGSSGAACPSGATCPNLDQLAPTLTLAIITHQVNVGGGVMPSFKGTLTPAQIKAVSQYVKSNAGK
jgi:mono/diheme cytochrome c family protein